MKTYTKYIKAQFMNDKIRVSSMNNSKHEQRSAEQNNQAYQDKKVFYIRKWNSLLEDATTATQRAYCKRMLDYIENYTRA